MYSNELGPFIPPLTSRAIQSTIINVVYNQPLVCGNQYHLEDLERKSSLFQLILSSYIKVHKVEVFEVAIK
jgi:hypothetical protein